MKKLALLPLCLLMMIAAIALADIAWPEDASFGQQQLKNYMEQVNATLATTTAGTIDVMHGLYPRMASFGMDGLTLPDDPFAPFDPPAEISVSLTEEGLHTLQLRMQDPDRFALVAAACIQASSPEVITWERAYGITSAYAAAIRTNPNASFAEDVNDLQGAQPRVYFAYYPNQFQDNHNWIQMTLVFARPGSADAQVVLPASTPAPELTEDGVWLSNDNFTHLEVFASPTPEPDSAAME